MAKLNASIPETGLPLTAQVEREIAYVAKKIRLNDLFTGAALLIVGTLTYALVAILLDKWLTLPAWARQIGFLGFASTLLGLAFFAIARPLMRVVNPRYVARQVEATMPQSKNELINWVDLQEQEMPGSVKSALASRAAEGFGEADVESAVRSKKFLWLGSTAAILVAVLAVLFLVFKGTQFASLVSRAFNPFQSGTVIAARTTIEVLEPTEMDAVVPDGGQLRFAIRLNGRVPDENASDKVRLKVRYNADTKDPEEIVFSKTDTLRDFDLTLTRGTIQNGFWYTIAAGDAETPEHRVTVRTKPMLKAFEVSYEYPAYLRIAPSQNSDPKWRGYPGTKVRLQVQTNREVKVGTLLIEPLGEVVNGTVVGEKNESLRFEKTVDRAGQYRVAFGSTTGESSGSSIPYPIEILTDAVPTITIEKPATDEITLPTNGLLEIDATIGDDFGIENTTLQFNLVNGPKLAGKKYLNAATFRRDKDGTFPTRVDYKDSVKLDQLKDDTGKTVALQVGQVLEFWLEAKDNCTVLPHELGKSKRYRVNLVAPPVKPEEQKKQEQQAGDRQKQDEQNQKNEKDKQANEERKPPQDPNQKNEPGEKSEQGGQGKKDTPPDPKDSKDQPNPKDAKADEAKNKGTGQGEPMPNTDQKADPMPNDKETQDKAKDIQDKIDDKNQKAGEGKPNPNASKPEGAEPPKAGEKKPDDQQPKVGQPNSESKPGDGTEKDPMAKPAGQNKDPGKVQPPETSNEKPEPNQKPGDQSKPESQPNGDNTKSAPKPEDKPGDQKNDKTEGATPKEQPKAGEKPKDEQAGGGKNEQSKGEEQPKKQDGKPEPGQAKPDGQPKPGQEKESPKSGGEEQGKSEERSAAGKDQKPEEAGNKKPESKEGKSAPPKNAGEPKPKPGDDAGMEKDDDAAKEKGDGAKQPETKDSKSGQDPNAKGEEKAVPKPGSKKDKPSAGGKDEKQEQKEIEDAVKDVDSKDPTKKKAAQDKLDKTVGKENREKTEQMKKDLNSDDAKTREDAKKKLDEMTKDGGKPNGDKPKEPTKEELDQLAKDAKDLNSPDADKKKAAEEKVDQKVGKENREKLQNEMKKQDADDKMAGEKKTDDAAKKAGKEPSKDDVGKMAEAAKDLNSPDEGKKKAAEEKLDQQLGKEGREQLQKEMKDLQGDDPKKAQEAKDRLEKLAKEWKPGNGGANGQESTPLVENAENRLKTSELQLDNLKKYRGDKNFLKENNMSDADYEKFLKGYEEMVDRQRKDVDNEKLNPQQARPNGSSSVGANDGSSGRLKTGVESGNAPAVGGPSFAPPGFSEAQRDFAKEAREAVEKKKK